MTLKVNYGYFSGVGGIAGNYIITEINGVKHYVRRYRIASSGYIGVTMVTTNIGKAKDFLSKERVQSVFKKMGIGYAIEIN